MEHIEGELVPMEHRDAMAIARKPAEVLAEAKDAALQLQMVVANKDKKVMMNGEQYLEFEDWQTLARFYGITARVVRTTFIDYGAARGFEATADAIDRDGRVISSAEAMCLNDEPKWSTRSKYEWQNRQKVKVGEEPVPLFQLRSMAQTRACAKALRNVLAWVVVLAGYRPTPAEDIQDQIPDGEDDYAPPGEVKKPTQKAPETTGTATTNKMSDAQKRKIFVQLTSLAVLNLDDQHKKIGAILGRPVEHIEGLSVAEASKVIDALGKEITEEKERS